MAESLNPVRPGETPPATGAEAFPVDIPEAPVPTALPSRTTPVESQQAQASKVSVYDAVLTPHTDMLAASRLAEATRDKASFSQSIVAGARSWATADLFRLATAPTFDPGDANVGELIAAVDFPLSEAELEYLRENKSNSLEEHAYRLQRVKDVREMSQAIGDNPVWGMVSQMLDPVWLVTGLASGGAAAALGVGRLARFGVGAGVETGAALGLNEALSQARPMDEDEKLMNVLTGALIGGGTALMIPNKAGRLTKADPDFPGEGLTDVARDVPRQTVTEDTILRQRPDGGGYDPVPNGPIRDTPAGARDLPPITRETQSIPTWDVHYAPVPIPRGAVRKTAREAVSEAWERTTDPVLKEFFQFFNDKLGPALDRMPVYFKDGDIIRNRPTVQGFYDIGGDRIQLKANTPDWVLAHELAHAVTVNKLKYGRRNRDTVHGRITTELESLYESAKQQLRGSDKSTAYLGSNLDEFVAGVFTRNPKFDEILSQLPDPGNPRRSMMGRVVDAVRRLMGIPVQQMNGFLRALDLVDELTDTPLKVIYHRPQRGAKSRYRAVETRADAVKAAQAEAAELNTTAQKLGEKWALKGGWNYHKTLSKYSKNVADTLLDDPIQQSKNSVDSWSRSIRAEFTTKQRVYEDNLRDMMAARGASLKTALLNPRKYRAVQRDLEKQLQKELDYRNNYFVQYQEKAPRRPGVSDDLHRLADSYEEATSFALEELKRSGVFGAEDIDPQAGYYPRRWSARALGDTITNLTAKGISEEATKRSIRDGFSEALLRMNPDWDQELADKVAKSMVDRMTRKGDLLDADFRSHIGNAELATISDMLDGLDPVDKARVLDKLAAVRDEANKATFLKSRLKLDIEHHFELPDGTTMRLGDLLEAHMSNLLERYLDEAAGRAAFARKGLVTSGDINDLKTSMIQEIRAKGGSTYEIEEANNLFDNAVNLLHGRPVGTDFTWGVRLSQSVTQMVGLGASGIWQITEYAKLLQKYGLLKSLKNMRKSMTFGEDLHKLTPEQATRLENILARNAYQDIRLRPLIEKLEDGFDIDPTNTVLQVANHAKQVVPYLNAMKYIHRHQANLVANLVTDTLEQAARGDSAARNVLKQYGIDLESPLMGNIVNDIRTHGGDTSKWADGTWDQLRNGLNRMMDDSVLRARRGEMPAFAQTTDLGKFVFTFRSFVLSAHNKTMMGTLNRDGFAGLSLLLMYQYPLSLMAVKMNNLKRGQEVDDDELVRQAIAQMGGLGLFTEVFGAVTGDKQQFGAPGLIAIDRGYKLLGEIGSGDVGGASAALLNALPLLPIIPFTNSLQETLKD